MMKHSRLALLALPITLTALSSSSIASQAANCIHIETQFIEGAPRDRFIVKNQSTNDMSIRALSLSLSTSAGKLIFDTQKGGNGVEVYQQFRSESTAIELISAPQLADGAEKLTLDFANFNKGGEYTFSLDVDDRLTNSDLGQIRIAGSEMNGAAITFSVIDTAGKNYVLDATFDQSNRALATVQCD